MGDKKDEIHKKYAQYAWDTLTNGECNEEEQCYIHLKGKSTEFTPVKSRDAEGNCLTPRAIVNKIMHETGLSFNEGPFFNEENTALSFNEGPFFNEENTATTVTCTIAVTMLLLMF